MTTEKIDRRKEILKSFTLEELKNKTTFWSVRNALQNIDRKNTKRSIFNFLKTIKL